MMLSQDDQVQSNMELELIHSCHARDAIASVLAESSPSREGDCFAADPSLHPVPSQRFAGTAQDIREAMQRRTWTWTRLVMTLRKESLFKWNIVFGHFGHIHVTAARHAIARSRSADEPHSGGSDFV